MSSTMRASAMHELPRPLVLCCHDAGSANLIAAWCAHDSGGIRLCAEGPARDIFARESPSLVPVSLEAAFKGAACLLSGTGWASTLEHESRRLARERSLPQLAVIDHWVNYAARFEREGRRILPDGFVVTDVAAENLVRHTFGSDASISVWYNAYLDREVAKVSALRACAAEPPRRLLVVLEPVRNDWQPGATRPAELRALDYLISRLDEVLPKGVGRAVRLRTHPSEATAKYEAWIAGRHEVTVEMSTGGSLWQDLAWADVVAGLNSYALVVARTAGRRAVSYLPPGAPSCTLMAEGIEFMSRVA
ncbi:MAG: hypothetical protein ABIQ86_05450 [Steroidobacteraceae bacterium]